MPLRLETRAGDVERNYHVITNLCLHINRCMVQATGKIMGTLVLQECLQAHPSESLRQREERRAGQPGCPRVYSGPPFIQCSSAAKRKEDGCAFRRRFRLLLQRHGRKNSRWDPRLHSLDYRNAPNRPPLLLLHWDEHGGPTTPRLRLWCWPDPRRLPPTCREKGRLTSLLLCGDAAGHPPFPSSTSPPIECASTPFPVAQPLCSAAAQDDHSGHLPVEGSPFSECPQACTFNVVPLTIVLLQQPIQRLKAQCINKISNMTKII